MGFDGRFYYLFIFSNIQSDTWNIFNLLIAFYIMIYESDIVGIFS